MMEKKNAMLLTVIAVATLFIAVVGATFAFFAINVENNTSATEAKISTGSVGSIALDSGSTSLSLSVTAEDMAKPEGETDKVFYADVSGKSIEEKIVPIAKVKVTGGDTTDTYSCQYTIKVTKSGTMVNAEGVDGVPLQAGDAFLILKASGLNSITGESSSQDGKYEIDLTKITDDGYKGTVTVNGAGNKAEGGLQEVSTDVVSAGLKFVNKHDTEQNGLAGKDLNVTITVAFDDGGCTIQPKTP